MTENPNIKQKLFNEEVGKEMWVCGHAQLETSQLVSWLKKHDAFCPTWKAIETSHYQPWWLFTAWENDDFRGFALLGADVVGFSPNPNIVPTPELNKTRLWLVEIRVLEQYRNQGWGKWLFGEALRALNIPADKIDYVEPIGKIGPLLKSFGVPFEEYKEYTMLGVERAVLTVETTSELRVWENFQLQQIDGP